MCCGLRCQNTHELNCDSRSCLASACWSENTLSSLCVGCRGLCVRSRVIGYEVSRCSTVDQRCKSHVTRLLQAYTKSLSHTLVTRLCSRAIELSLHPCVTARLHCVRPTPHRELSARTPIPTTTRLLWLPAIRIRRRRHTTGRSPILHTTTAGQHMPVLESPHHTTTICCGDYVQGDCARSQTS